MTQPLTTTNLEELLEQEVPCGTCGREALLRSNGHDCPCLPGPFYKCLDCYVTWVAWISGMIAHHNSVRCRDCQVRYPTVESFSHYRQF